MKNMSQNKSTHFLALFLAGLLAFSACKDKDPIDPGMGTFEIHMHNYIGDNEVEDYGAIYKNEAGRKIALDLAQVYLSHVQLVKADGSLYSLAGKFY